MTRICYVVLVEDMRSQDPSGHWVSQVFLKRNLAEAYVKRENSNKDDLLYHIQETFLRD